GYDQDASLIHGLAEVLGALAGGVIGEAVTLGNPWFGACGAILCGQAGKYFSHQTIEYLNKQTAYLCVTSEGSTIYLRSDNSIFVDNGSSKVTVDNVQDANGNTFGFDAGRPVVTTPDGWVGDITILRSTDVHRLETPTPSYNWREPPNAVGS